VREVYAMVYAFASRVGCRTRPASRRGISHDIRDGLATMRCVWTARMFAFDGSGVPYSAAAGLSGGPQSLWLGLLLSTCECTGQ